MKMIPRRLSVSLKPVLAVAAAVAMLPLLSLPASAAGSNSVDHIELVSVNAKLTTRLNTKKARLGERITAKLTSSVKAADSMDLPKGTLLLGKVEQVRMSSDNSPSKLSILFNQARLQDGRTIPIKATVLGAYPGASWDSFNYTGTGGPHVGVQSHYIPYNQKVDQEPGTLSHVAMHSAVQSQVSAVFTSRRHNIDLHRGTELQFAIAPATTARKRWSRG